MIGLPTSFPRLETRRLLLREFRGHDVEDIVRVLGDPAVIRYLNFEQGMDRARATRLVERRREAFFDGRSLQWALIDRVTGRCVGSCGFCVLMREWGFGELGYELAADKWGQGLMGEALEEVLRYGFQSLELHRAEAEVMVENHASKRLLEKLGFQFEGLLRERGFWGGRHHDLQMFSLLSSEFGNRPNHSSHPSS